MKLLLAEDDPMIGPIVERGLRASGFTVDWVRDGKAAALALESTRYSLLVLDLGLPRMDGLAVLRQIRESAQGPNRQIPVLIVTARDAVTDRIAGLNLGADDYLVKPFDLDELIARAHALVRRAQGRAQSDIRIGPLSLDPLSMAVQLDGQPLLLSQREFNLLRAFMETPGEVLSKEALEDRLYGWDEEVASNAVEVHIHNLRRKLGAEWIRNVRGVGYKLVQPGILTQKP